MKKVITLILIFIMILCSSALADPDFIGAWATVRDLDNSVTEIVILRVFLDNKVYYSRQQFTENSLGEEEKHLYTWEAENDQIFQLINDAGDVIDRCGMIGDRRLLGYTDMFARFDYYARETPQSEPEPTETPETAGITVPSGVYVAGEDFPVGTYRVELADPDNGGVFLLYDSIGDVNTAFAYLYEYRISKYSSPVVGKIEIKAGNALAVRNTVIVLLPYEGLQ